MSQCSALQLTPAKGGGLGGPAGVAGGGHASHMDGLMKPPLGVQWGSAASAPLEQQQQHWNEQLDHDEIHDDQHQLERHENRFLPLSSPSRPDDPLRPPILRQRQINRESRSVMFSSLMERLEVVARRPSRLGDARRYLE